MDLDPDPNLKDLKFLDRYPDPPSLMGLGFLMGLKMVF